MSVVVYTGLLMAVGLGRIIEMSISRRHQRQLAAHGARKIPERYFLWMVLFHGGILFAAGLEVWLLHRPLIPLLALPMTLIFVLANILRWWVIRTLAIHWNIQVVDSHVLGVVSSGPYRWIRHPNYVAVYVELIALPLIHTAWLTALLGGLLHIWILRRRIMSEEAVLFANQEYRDTMGPKPRFLPRSRW